MAYSVCAGFGGFVPRMQNRLGLTFNEATHAALNEFTDEVNAKRHPAVTADQCVDISSSFNDSDNASCHTGCSTQPPRRC